MDHGIIERFNFWCTKVLPLVYDNSLSYYEVLCKLTKFIKELVLELDSWEQFNEQLQADVDQLKKEWPEFKTELEGEFDDFKNQTLEDIAHIEQDMADFEESMKNQQQSFEDQMNQNQNDFENQVNGSIANMNNTLDDIKNGDYVDLYLDSIKNYIDNNLQNFVADLVKYITFGLSHDGHFVAYIPDTWEFIQFSTITDPDSTLYNHLVLTW